MATVWQSSIASIDAGEVVQSPISTTSFVCEPPRRVMNVSAWLLPANKSLIIPLRIGKLDIDADPIATTILCFCEMDKSGPRFSGPGK
jgi:hypothetical protein